MKYKKYARTPRGCSAGDGCCCCDLLYLFLYKIYDRILYKFKCNDRIIAVYEYFRRRSGGRNEE